MFCHTADPVSDPLCEQLHAPSQTERICDAVCPRYGTENHRLALLRGNLCPGCSQCLLRHPGGNGMLSVYHGNAPVRLRIRVPSVMDAFSGHGAAHHMLLYHKPAGRRPAECPHHTENQNHRHALCRQTERTAYWQEPLHAHSDYPSQYRAVWHDIERDFREILLFRFPLCPPCTHYVPRDHSRAAYCFCMAGHLAGQT